MIFEEKTVSSEKIFQGKVVSLRVDQVAMPDGGLAQRELVGHPGGVGVVAITDTGEILMVRQFRKPLEKAILEIPAGKLEAGEDPLVCGMRELEEETGMRAEKFESLGYLYPSPGYLEEVIHLYLATGLYPGEANPDPDEYLDLIRMSLKEAEEKVMNHEIADAKTVCGILKAIRKWES